MKLEIQPCSWPWAGAAYAIDKVDSRRIVNGTIRSVDLKDRKAVRASDVRPDGLRGNQIDERTLDASSFAPVAGSEEGDCDPSSSAFTDCASVALRLHARSRLLVVATGNPGERRRPGEGNIRGSD